MSASLTEQTLKHMQEESPSKSGGILRQVILGGQDGIVNVLGILLGVAKATSNPQIVLVAGLAATFAESISMGAVAYTTSQAERDFYRRQREKERREIEEIPEIEREEIRLIFMKKGFRGAALSKIVSQITSDKELWLLTMMREELGFSDSAEGISPIREGLVVMLSAFVGSFLPLLPFIFLPVLDGIYASVALSALVLFLAGFVKGRITTGNPFLRGLELAAIGLVSAFAGYLIGALFGATGVS